MKSLNSYDYEITNNYKLPNCSHILTSFFFLIRTSKMETENKDFFLDFKMILYFNKI